jgi:hypothetical protein
VAGRTRRGLARFGTWVLRVLEGENRIAHGWGFLPMGVGLSLWAYAYAPKATRRNPFPLEPGWRVPIMYFGVALAVLGIFLFVAPRLRSWWLAHHPREQPGPAKSFAEAAGRLNKRGSSNKESAEAQSTSTPSPVDLTITADGKQIHVRNDGPRAEFTAEIAGVIYPNGTELTKHASLSWVRQDSDDLSMKIPTSATRTIVLWDIKDSFLGNPALFRIDVHLLAWSDGIIPVGDNQAIGVRLRIVRTDPPGVMERIITIGNRTSDDGNRREQRWYCEVKHEP